MRAVSRGANDAKESAAPVTAGAPADRLCVVPQQMRPGIEQSRERVAGPPLSFQETEHIPLGLPSRHSRPAERRSVGRRDEGHGHDD
jgi:hypothetical protein